MSEQVVFVLFRVLNFLVLIAVLTYLFWRYGLPSIQKRMAEDRRQKEARSEEKKRLVGREEELVDEQAQQDDFCRHLHETVAQWRRAVQNEVEHRKAQKKAIDQQLEVRILQQQGSFEKTYIAKNVVPEATEQVKRNLQTYYTDERHGREFIKKLIKDIKESCL